MTLRVAVLTSRAAPGLEALLADPNRGVSYELAAVVSTETSLLQSAALDAAGVPWIVHPIRDFHARRNLRAREDYDASLAAILRRLGAQYVILCGYRYIVTAPLLHEFSDRIIGMIDSDLTEQDDAGLHAVRNAIMSGATETRSSAYIVRQGVGTGPLFLLSGAYPVAPMARDARNWGDAALVERYAGLHRQWMQRAAWGPMLVRVLELLAGGTIAIAGDVVWIDGAPGPCRFGEAPATCTGAHIEGGIPSSCPFIAGG